MTSETVRFIFDHPLKQLPTEKKEGKVETQYFEYLENEKTFLVEIKNIFCNYLWDIIRWKNKK